jgi:hypothetical protein
LAILGTLRNGLGDYWHIAAGTEEKPTKNLSDVAYWAMPLCILRCDICDMPTVGPSIARSATVGKLDAES